MSRAVMGWVARALMLGAVMLAGCDGGSGQGVDAGPDPDAGPPMCDGCRVGGVCFPSGVVDPSDPCGVCDPTRAADAFSPNVGASCDDGAFCTTNDVCGESGCAGSARSCDDGIACTEAESCDEDADACLPGASSCATGEVCDAVAGECVGECSGCLVDGVCYGDGQVDPSNACQVCDVATSATAFSPNDGASCDDGAFCTVGDVCAAGVCAGSARSCADAVACNGEETCDEATDACVAGTSTCALDQVCDVATSACVTVCTGCVIDGVCYGAGQRNPLNPCEVCAPDTSRAAFSPNDGASCDDGQFCTMSDVCAGTSCVGTARSCEDGVACNGAESCDEASDRCVAGATTCTDGRVCDTATDSCVLSCVGGSTLCGSSCVDVDSDPAFCGSCATACPSGPNATAVCVSRVCDLLCAEGAGDCTAAAGCETDLRTDADNCGACGLTCREGESCVAGRCVDGSSCRDILAAAPGSRSGTYLLDPDGAGGDAPFTAYCDMTTAGGGWTLVYKVRNDVGQGAPSWWNVMLGTGTTFPNALTRPSGSSEGPTSATRAALFAATGATEWRGTMIRDSTSAVLYDVRSSYTGEDGRGFRCFATGTCTSVPGQACSPTASAATVISTAIGGPVAAGATGHLCDIGWTSCTGCVDWIHVSSAPSMSGADRTHAFVGDDYIERTDTTTYFWIR